MHARPNGGVSGMPAAGPIRHVNVDLMSPSQKPGLVAIGFGVLCTGFAE
jgi:hypothetical protein